MIIEKEFKSPSLSRTTCAASTQIMGKQAYHFNEEEHVCQILNTISSTNSFESESPMIDIWIKGMHMFN